MVFRIKNLKKKKEKGWQVANEVHSPSSHGRFCLHNPLPGGSGLRGPEIMLKNNTGLNSVRQSSCTGGFKLSDVPLCSENLYVMVQVWKLFFVTPR